MGRIIIPKIEKNADSNNNLLTVDQLYTAREAMSDEEWSRRLGKPLEEATQKEVTKVLKNKHKNDNLQKVK